MLQLQFEPGAMPAASTSATKVAMGGATGTGGAAATTGIAWVTGATTATAGVTGAGATVVDVVVGVAPAEIAGRETAVGGVVVVPSAAPVVALGVVRAGCGLEDGTDDGPWGCKAMTVVTARIAVTPTAMRRTPRRLPRGEVRRIFRLTPSTPSVSGALSWAGEAGGVLSTMC
jgi:hypothetical protein